MTELTSISPTELEISADELQNLVKDSLRAAQQLQTWNYLFPEHFEHDRSRKSSKEPDYSKIASGFVSHVLDGKVNNQSAREKLVPNLNEIVTKIEEHLLKIYALDDLNEQRHYMGRILQLADQNTHPFGLNEYLRGRYPFSKRSVYHC